MAIQHYRRRYTARTMLMLHPLRHRGPLRAWGLSWALVAALALALLPTVSRALAAPGPAVAVCTADGVQWMRGDAGADTGAGHGAAMLQACALCVLAGSALAPPPQGHWAGAAVRSAPAVAGPGTPLADLAPPWPAGQPRAPPVWR
jgi:hypothetical protein